MSRRIPLLALALIAACKSSSGAVVVPSLDRPGPLAFACYDEVQLVFRANLHDCDGLLGDSSEKLRIISFVLETTRGEVGAIDWQLNRAIDSDRTVPGFTFVRVGEAPSAIVIPEDDSRMTFVANYGSYDVQSLETAAFIPDAVQDTADALHPTTVTLPAGPTDLVYFATANARWLFAALPDAGAIAQIPVGADGSLGTPVIVPVSTTVPAGIAAPAIAETARTCPLDQVLRTATAAPRTPTSLGLDARPARFALVDRGGGTTQLVATDESLPMLHRFDLGDAGVSETTGFGVAVPTLDVVATPLVPAAVYPNVAAPAITEQYLYAIDALDRSVLVVDVTSGAVLPVNVGDRAPDRVDMSVGAIALDVLTPGYHPATDPTLAARCSASSSSSVRSSVTQMQLNGVFVATATTDGNVGFVDVFDLDGACRGTTACGGVGNANDEMVTIRRHRPRAQVLRLDPPTIGSTIAFQYLGNAGGLAATGEAASGTGPGLLPLDDGDPSAKLCPGTSPVAGRGQMMVGFTASGGAVQDEPLICLLDDRSALRIQIWSAEFEGLIPTASGVRGQLVDAGGPRFVTEDGRFCEWGVLGGADVAAATLGPNDPELGYGGDLLEIVADVSPELATTEACKEFVIPTNADRVRLAFSIVEAHANELVLGAYVPDAGYTLGTTLTPANGFAKLRACFPSLVSYVIRSHDAYTVSAALALPRHRVIDDGSGRCTIDVAGQPFDPSQPDTARAFRAMPGRNFVHPQVAFRISSFQVASGAQALLQFSVYDLYTGPLRIDAGVLGGALRYNVADERFYVVDIPSHSVSQFGLTPLAPPLVRVQ